MDATFLSLLKSKRGWCSCQYKKQNGKNREQGIRRSCCRWVNVLSSFKGFDRDRSRDHCIAQIKQQLNSLSNNDGEDHESVIYEVALLQTLSRLVPQFQFAKCWQFFSGVEFQKPVSKYRKRKSKSVSCAFVLHKKVRIGIFTSYSCGDGIEMYKKAWCACKVVVLPI